MMYRFVEYNENYDSGVLTLLGSKWKTLTPDQVIQRFRWRYINNPNFHKWHIKIALYGEEVIGFRAFVIQPYFFNDRIINVYKPADAILDENHRRKGLFSKLNLDLIETICVKDINLKVVINLSSNHLSTPAYLKLGWLSTKNIIGFYFRIYPFNFLKPVIQEIDGYSSDKVIISHELSVEKLVRFNRDYKPAELYSVKNEDYYKWRYQYGKSDYFSAMKLRNGEIVSYMIFRRINKLHYSIEEYGSKIDIDMVTLLKEVVKNVPIRILRCTAFNDISDATVRKLGLIKESKYLLSLLRLKRQPILVNYIDSRLESIKLEHCYITGSDIH